METTDISVIISPVGKGCSLGGADPHFFRRSWPDAIPLCIPPICLRPPCVGWLPSSHGTQPPYCFFALPFGLTHTRRPFFACRRSAIAVLPFAPSLTHMSETCLPSLFSRRDFFFRLARSSFYRCARIRLSRRADSSTSLVSPVGILSPLSISLARFCACLSLFFSLYLRLHAKADKTFADPFFSQSSVSSFRSVFRELSSARPLAVFRLRGLLFPLATKTQHRIDMVPLSRRVLVTTSNVADRICFFP